jgi:taurine dioxygenase
MQVLPLSDALGAQLVDFDIGRPVTGDEQQELRELFCEHHLLLVRAQRVTEDDQTRFVGNFGPVKTRGNGSNETFIANVTADGDPNPATGTATLLWHQDGAYGPQPGIATSLWAKEVAPDCVPTVFANGVRALDRMSPELRARIEPLHVLNVRDRVEHKTDRRWLPSTLPADAPPDRFARFEHPVIYPLPHCDQKTIIVNEYMTCNIVELPFDEGEALIQELFTIVYADDNTYEHQWQTNDVIIWDNIALHHTRPAEMGLAVRRLRRQTLDGWYTSDGVLEWVESAADYLPQSPATGTM